MTPFYTTEKKTELYNALCEYYPTLRDRPTISRKMLVNFFDQCEFLWPWPWWIANNKIGRGQYTIPLFEIFPEKVYNNESSDVENKIAMQSTSLSLVTDDENIIPIVTKSTKKSGMIPTIDKNFVRFGVYNDLDLILKSNMFYPVYVSGPTGNGKSTMVEQICAQRNRELIRVNLNLMTDEDQLIGSKTLVNGSVRIVDGPVIIAMRRGAVLLLDECDAGGANVLLCLQPILEGKPYYFKLNNEVIIPEPGFNIIATGNTKGKGSTDGRYIGTNVLNEAFLERFSVTLEQEYPSEKEEVKIIKRLMKSLNVEDEFLALSLGKWASSIRATFNDGGIDELITTRRLVHIIKATTIFKPKKAVELCCNRFDSVVKIAFIELFDKIYVKPDVEETSTKVEDRMFDDEIQF